MHDVRRRHVLNFLVSALISLADDCRDGEGDDINLWDIIRKERGEIGRVDPWLMSSGSALHEEPRLSSSALLVKGTKE